MEEREIIKKYLIESKHIADSVCGEDVISIANIIYKTFFTGKDIYICGNGGSASNASHFTCDLLKLGFNVHCLNDNGAISSMITNDDGFDKLYSLQLQNMDKDDILICFSVHGGTGQDKAGLWSQNLLQAVNLAKNKSAKIIGFAGYDGGMLAKCADACIIVGYSTPQTESWHSQISHLIVELLKEKNK